MYVCMYVCMYVFLDWKRWTGCERWRWVVYVRGANNFLILILRCHLLQQILSEINFFWSQKKVSCLKQGSKMNWFCLKEGQGLKALAAHPHPNFPSSPPPLGIFTTQKRNIYYNLLHWFHQSWSIKLQPIEIVVLGGLGLIYIKLSTYFAEDVYWNWTFIF